MASTNFIAAFQSAPLLGPTKPPAGKPQMPAAGSSTNPTGGAALSLPPLSLSAALPSWAGPVAIAAALVIALTMLRTSRGRRR